MKKKTLLVNYELDGLYLIGITCVIKEYKLAWLINRGLGIGLSKQADLRLEFVKGQDITLSNFLFETEHSKLWLLRNEALGGETPGRQYLVPELAYLDFLVLINDFGQIHELEVIKSGLRAIRAIQFLQEIDINQLKSKDNLIF
ncbi:MAG: IPExxxVDY family protein [Cytophagales bacterium]|nr:IPExxxVDY family protein [Cytophagales bacterium]